MLTQDVALSPAVPLTEDYRRPDKMGMYADRTGRKDQLGVAYQRVQQSSRIARDREREARAIVRRKRWYGADVNRRDDGFFLGVILWIPCFC